MAAREHGGGAQNRAADAAHMYSVALVNKLQTNPSEIQLLLRSLTNVCATVPSSSINEWHKKLNAVPYQFYFSNCNVSYRQQVHGGMLLITECIMTPQWHPQHWRNEGTSSVLNAVFFVGENIMTGNYEVRSLPPQTIQQKGTVTLFGIQFLEVISKIDHNVKRPDPMAPVPVKKPWWKRIFLGD